MHQQSIGLLHYESIWCGLLSEEITAIVGQKMGHVIAPGFCSNGRYYEMEAIYHQSGYVLEVYKIQSLIISALPAIFRFLLVHKIGDAYDFSTRCRCCLYRFSLYLIYFHWPSDYDTISEITDDVYELLKWWWKKFFKSGTRWSLFW